MRGNLGFLAAALLLGAAVFDGSDSLSAQTRAKAATTRPWRVPRTADGRPDLQGMWTNATLTPLERPRAMADRAFLTEQEAAALEARAAGREAEADDAGARQQALARGDVGSYNQFWFDAGSKVLPSRQTSLVVDPPDGRVPVRPEAEARRDDALKRSADHPEFMSVWDRCISRGVPGWIIPAGYNNAYQIVQTPGYVVIHAEMIHDARIIPLDGRAPLPSRIRLLEGDSRGRWEGDTLVVETTNFDDGNWIATSAASGRIKGIPQSTALRIVERFTRTAADRIDYEARIEDPAVFSRPWTLAFPLTRDDEYRIYEYACHEGNRAIEGVLSGARYQERSPKGTRATEAQTVDVATTVAFTEGPTVAPDGSVYFTDIITQRIMKLGADGVLSVFREKSNVANGLLIDPQGRLIACEGAEFSRPGVTLRGIPRVTRTDLKTGAIEVLAERYEGKPLVGPNDITIDSKGRLYFTELNGAAVYRIDAPGQLTRILAAPEVQRPNGIQISPDDRTLYLVEANGAPGGARLIRRYDLQPDGSVRNMRVHYDFSPGRSADGMSIDTQGNLYASAGMNQLRGTSETLATKAGVYVISPKGTLVTFIPIAEDFITNNAFGGPDMRTLYVTAGKTLYKVRTDVPGLPR